MGPSKSSIRLFSIFEAYLHCNETQALTYWCYQGTHSTWARTKWDSKEAKWCSHLLFFQSNIWIQFFDLQQKCKFLLVIGWIAFRIYRYHYTNKLKTWSSKIKGQNTKVYIMLVSRAKHLTIDCFFSFKNLVVSLSNLASKALTSLSNSLISLKKTDPTRVSKEPNH